MILLMGYKNMVEKFLQLVEIAIKVFRSLDKFQRAQIINRDYSKQKPNCRTGCSVDIKGEVNGYLF